MKHKAILSLLSVLVFSVVMVSLVVANPDFSLSKSTINFQKPTTSDTFVLTTLSSNSSSFSVEIPAIKDKDNNNIPISVSGNLFGLSPSNPQTITVSTTIDYTKLEVGKTYSGNLIIRNLQNTADTKTIVLNFNNNFCKYAENGSLELSNIDIKNEDGDDDTSWAPLNHIKIDVKVSNNGDNSAKSVVVEMGVIDSNGKNIVNDLLNLEDKKITIGTINDGDDKSISYEFDVPADFEEDTYKLVLKTYSTKTGEKASCIANSDDLDQRFYQSIDGIRETTSTNHLAVSNIVLSPTTAQCSDKVQISADVSNIGDTDYSDQVKVNIYNTELKLNKDVLIKEDFNQGDSYTLDADFDLPANAKEKTYTINFRTYYDYNSRTDTYRITSSKTFTIPLVVSGNCNGAVTPETPTTTTGANAQITAELDPETPSAVAGNQLIIKSTIKNTGDAKATYTLSVNGNSAWSSVTSLEPQVITLENGESRDFNVVLNVDKTAVGDKEFFIKANYGDKSTEYKLSLTVAKAEVQSEAIINHFKNNWFIYLIVLINVVLIVAIIMVIRRMLRPRRMAEM